jgi:hypothetical protein
MNVFEEEFLLKLSKIGKQLVDAAEVYRNSLATPGLKDESAAVKESNFDILKFESQKGAKLGEFEVAHKKANVEDKWQTAFTILRNSNSTIEDRYHGIDYQYSYWLYGYDKIYRQKLKSK